MPFNIVNPKIFPLFETLAIKNGTVQNLALHQARYHRSLLSYYGKNYTNLVVADLAQLLATIPPKWLTHQMVRCRIAYNHSHQQVNFFTYQTRQFKQFQPVICEQINYSLKYSDRSQLEQLLTQRGKCDEIIIVKNGKLTDCSIGNLVLKRQGEWFTPDSPLLAGTKRQQLLYEQRIQQRYIPLTQLDLFEEIRVINALNDLVE